MLPQQDISLLSHHGPPGHTPFQLFETVGRHLAI